MGHRALLLPEIVAKILESGAEEPGLLYNSLQVNHLFLQEASRILWFKCDDSDGAGQTHPDIHHLGELVLRQDAGPERAQTYASLVRQISFNYDLDLGIDQHSWHSVLSRLRFPRLTQAWLWETERTGDLVTETVLLNYISPGLNDLHAACGPLSDVFFDSLAERCSNVRDFNLQPTKVIASASSIARALSAMTNVTSLNLERGFRAAVSASMLEAIASLPKVEQLSLPEVPSDSLSKLSISSERRWFPQLKYLYIGATASTLELVHQIVPKLEAIGVFNEQLGQTNNILSALSHFTQLTTITVLLRASSTFRGTELIHLAQSCPNLQDLQIGIDSWSEELPTATGITDDLIRDFATHAPKLQRLNLTFDSETRPGLVKTLQTLGRHCPLLEELMFSCKADWRSHLDIPRDVPLGQFKQLCFLPDEHMRQCLTRDEKRALLDLWHLNGNTWLPEIELLQIPREDDWETEFIVLLCPSLEPEEAESGDEDDDTEEDQSEDDSEA